MYLQTPVLEPRLEMYFVAVLELSCPTLVTPWTIASQALLPGGKHGNPL